MHTRVEAWGRGVVLVHTVAILAAAGLLAACKREQPVLPAQATPVHYQLARNAQDASSQSRPAYLAVVRGDRETDLSFKVGGIIDLIGRSPGQDWVEGAEVKAGDVLAQLRQSDFINATNSAHAKAELDASQLKRAEMLIKDGAISKQEYESARANQMTSSAALAQSVENFHESTLRAPFTGTILTRLANSGETVPAGHTVLRLASLDTMSVEVGVPDRIVGSIQVGQNIRIRIAGIESETSGTVSEVGVAAREGGRLFRVVIKIANEKRKIKSGMMANVYLTSDFHIPAGAVLVPLSALVGSHSTGLSVFIVGDDDRVSARPVKTDDIQRSSILITEGIKPGEKIVTLGASRLYDGALVDPKPAPDDIFSGEVR
jgi:RND family efflux transporter MFP subunit